MILALEMKFDQSFVSSSSESDIDPFCYSIAGCVGDQGTFSLV